MKWLKAELEIRGYSRCAKRPEKCKKEVREVVERCERGDCFLDPDKVLREAKEVLSHGERGISVTQVVVGIIVVLIIFNIVGLYLFYNKLNETVREMSMLKKEIDSLKWTMRTNSFRINNVEVKLNNLAKQVDRITKSVEALKIAIFYLDQR